MPSRRREEEYDDYDDTPEKKGGTQWGIIGGLAGLVVLLGIALLFASGGSDNSDDKDNDNSEVAGRNEDQGSAPPVPSPPRDGNPPPPPTDNDPPPKDDSGTNNPPPNDDPPSTQIEYRELTGEEIYNRTIQSTAWIFIITPERAYGWGSGSLIHNSDRLVVTNYHVVGKQKEVLVFFPAHESGRPISQAKHYLKQAKTLSLRSKVVWRNPKVDLALIQLPYVPKGVIPLPLAEAGPATASTIHSIGASGVDIRSLQGALWQYVKGEVRQTSRRNDLVFAELGRLDALIVETTGATNKGDSGGPVVNDRGELVAVVQGGDPSKNNVAFNISVEEVRSQMEAYYRSIGKVWNEERAPSLRRRPNLSVAALVERLAHKRASVRVEALEALGDLGPEASPAWKKMLPLLDDSDELVKREAREALDELGPLSRFDVDELRKLLQHQSFHHRLFAVKQLAKLGRSASDASQDLVKIMQDDDNRFVRKEAIHAVGKLGPAAARHAGPALLTMVESGADPELTCCAIAALRGIGSQTPQLREALNKAYESSDPEVQAEAFQALVGTGALPLSQIIEAMGSSNSKLAGLAEREAQSREKRINAGEVPALRVALKSPNSQAKRLALRVIQRLKGAAKEAIPELAELAKGTNQEMRIEALETIAEMEREAESVMPTLLPLLGDPDRMIQGTAAYCITRLRAKLTPTQVKEVMTKLVQGAVPQSNREIVNKELAGVGRKIQDLLVRIGPSAATAICIQLNKSMPNNDVSKTKKLVWLGVLSEIGPRGASQPNLLVVRNLSQRDPSSSVRARASSTLRTMLGR